MSLATIPTEWKEIVCGCPRAWYDERPSGYPRRTFKDDGTRLFICVTCNKPSAHCIFMCVHCSDVFLKDYSHPNWVLEWPACWACCESNENPAARIQVGYMKQPRVKPTLRPLYIHITEGVKIPSLFDL